MRFLIPLLALGTAVTIAASPVAPIVVACSSDCIASANGTLLNTRACTGAGETQTCVIWDGQPDSGRHDGDCWTEGECWFRLHYELDWQGNVACTSNPMCACPAGETMSVFKMEDGEWIAKVALAVGVKKKVMVEVPADCGDPANDLKLHVQCSAAGGSNEPEAGGGSYGNVELTDCSCAACSEPE